MFIQNKFLKFTSILILRKLMENRDPETNKGLALYIIVAMKLRKTLHIWACYNLWETLICRVSLERSLAFDRWRSERLPLNFGVPLSWPRLWLAWVLGSGLSGLDASVSGSALGSLHSRFHSGV